MVNFLKFRALIACQNLFDNQCTPSPSVFPVCYSDTTMQPAGYQRGSS